MCLKFSPISETEIDHTASQFEDLKPIEVFRLGRQCIAVVSWWVGRPSILEFDVLCNCRLISSSSSSMMC